MSKQMQEEFDSNFKCPCGSTNVILLSSGCHPEAGIELVIRCHDCGIETNLFLEHEDILKKGK